MPITIEQMKQIEQKRKTYREKYKKQKKVKENKIPFVKIEKFIPFF
jgi:hypothetical protein